MNPIPPWMYLLTSSIILYGISLFDRYYSKNQYAADNSTVMRDLAVLALMLAIALLVLG